GLEFRHLFDLDQTHPARPQRGHAVVVAEDGDLDAGPPGGVVDGRPLRDGDRPPVDGHRHHWHTICHPLTPVCRVSCVYRVFCVSCYPSAPVVDAMDATDAIDVLCRGLNITAPCLDMVFVLVAEETQGGVDGRRHAL